MLRPIRTLVKAARCCARVDDIQPCRVATVGRADDDAAWLADPLECSGSVGREPAQDLGIAADLIDDYAKIPKVIEDGTSDLARDLEACASTAWNGAWEHLDHARKLLRSIGRETAAYDERRATETNRHGGTAQRPLKAHLLPRGRGWVIETARESDFALTHALDALRFTAPEVPVRVSVAPDLRRHAWLDRVPARRIAILLVMLAIAAVIRHLQ
jgi:hypothetical protein